MANDDTAVIMTKFRNDVADALRVLRICVNAALEFAKSDPVKAKAQVKDVGDIINWMLTEERTWAAEAKKPRVRLTEMSFGSGDTVLFDNESSRPSAEARVAILNSAVSQARSYCESRGIKLALKG